MKERFISNLAVFPALRPHRTRWGTSCRQRFARHRSAGRRAAGRKRTRPPAGCRSRYLGRLLVPGNLPHIQSLTSKAWHDLKYNQDVSWRFAEVSDLVFPRSSSLPCCSSTERCRSLWSWRLSQSLSSGWTEAHCGASDPDKWSWPSGGTCEHRWKKFFPILTPQFSEF